MISVCKPAICISTLCLWKKCAYVISELNNLIHEKISPLLDILVSLSLTGRPGITEMVRR